MTNHLIDLQHSDCILIQGSDAAENHPISFNRVLKAKDKGAEVIVNPRFARTSARSSMYAPLRSGTDIAFLGGMIKYILDHDLYFKDYVLSYTNAAFLVNPKFSFNDGLFSGYDAQKHAYDKSSWSFQKDDKGLIKRDDTLKNPHCVFQLMKKHYDRYDLKKVPVDHGDARGGICWPSIRPSPRPASRTRPGPSCMPSASATIPWPCRTSAR